MKVMKFWSAVRIICAVLLAALLPAGAVWSGEKDKEPYPKYWMSVSTKNFSIPGMPADMPSLGGMFGGRMGGPNRGLLLQLNSPRPLPAEPSATHDIPPGQSMGGTLPLIIPPKPGAERSGESAEGPGQFEKPKARMLIYWGCGEKVKPGQPRVLDTEKMSPEEFGKAMSGHFSSAQYPPAPRTGWIYSEWPNEKNRVNIPGNSSLEGEHVVHGNYIPDIRFSIDKKHDFMAPVEFTSVTGERTESMKVRWRAIPTATGYFAMAMARNEKNGETIIWTTSGVPEPGYGLMNYLPGADVRRLIREKVIMPPDVTSCSVPKGIFSGSEGAMLQFIAYGDDLQIAYPPKPKDPRKPWNPLWAVKVRLKSTGMTPLGNPGQPDEQQAREQGSKSPGKSPGAEGSPSEGRAKGKEGSGSPLNVIKGLFGF